MMTAHLTKLANQMNVSILAHLPFVEVEPDVKQKDIRESVSAHKACKEILTFPAQKWAVNPMTTAPLMKNATTKAESVFSYVSLPTHVYKVQDVRQIIIERHAPATTPYKEMATPLAILVSTKFLH